MEEGRNCKLQYELSMGPSIGKAVTTLKWSLELYPCGVDYKSFPVHFSWRWLPLQPSALLQPMFSMQFEPTGPDRQPGQILFHFSILWSHDKSGRGLKFPFFSFETLVSKVNLRNLSHFLLNHEFQDCFCFVLTYSF